MKTRGDGICNFSVCDFCDRDSSNYGIAWIEEIGQKGICNNCITDLKNILAKAEEK